MKSALAVLALVLALPCAASAGSVEWIQNDYDGALARAKEQKKLVHLHWTATWAPWSRELEDKTFADDGVAAFLGANFINLRMDLDKYAQTAQKFHVGQVPDSIFLMADGRAVKRVVGYMDAAEFLAEAKKAVGNAERLPVLEELVKKDERTAETRMELATLLAGAGDSDLADKHFRAVVELDKDNAKGLASEAWVRLGDASFLANEPNMQEAKKAYQAAQALDPKNEKRWTDNAEVKLAEIEMNGNPAEARKMLEKVVADYPKTDGAAEAMFMIAALMADGDQDLDGAEAQLKKLQAEMPDDPWAKAVPPVLKQIESMRKPKENKDGK